jgi:nucleotide-binding universal stress UspA family protein
MITVTKILCPVDFFTASQAAASYAMGLAAIYEARIHLLHVIAPIPMDAINVAEITESLEKKAAYDLKKLVQRAQRANVEADFEIHVGDVYDEIKNAIEMRQPNLVVMGTHGRRGIERWFIGSTTEKLLRHSPVPLLTISASDKKVPVPRFRRILVTTDFSDGTSDALAYAFSIAQEYDARITLLHVIHDVAIDSSGTFRDALLTSVEKALQDLVPPEAADWCDVNTRIETGVPYQIILKTLEDERIDLVVMNIHGKGLLDRALLGSTAERVMRAAPCPVLLIPPMKRRKRELPLREDRAA